MTLYTDCLFTTQLGLPQIQMMGDLFIQAECSMIVGDPRTSVVNTYFATIIVLPNVGQMFMGGKEHMVALDIFLLHGGRKKMMSWQLSQGRAAVVIITMLVIALRGCVLSVPFTLDYEVRKYHMLSFILAMS